MELPAKDNKYPVLVPIEPDVFFAEIRRIVREELEKLGSSKLQVTYEVPGLTYKPLYKIAELCTMLQVTKPTIYDWIKQGILKPYKVNSRTFFLYEDIIRLLKPANNG